MLEAQPFKPEPLAAESPVVVAEPLPFPGVMRSRRAIRAPFRIVWREFRFRFLPLLAFILAGVFAVIVWRQWVTMDQVQPPTDSFAGQPNVMKVSPIADKTEAPRLGSVRN